MGRSIRTGLLVLTLLLVGACELRTQLNITVDADGSGIVEVVVGLDEESATLRPDLLDDLDVDHLVDVGWEVTGPVPEDGFHWVRARHAFDTAEDVGMLVDQVAGETGPFRDFEITRSSGITSESFRFTGAVDFGGLAESTVAEEVAGAVDPALPAADVIEELDARFGAAVDEIVQVQVAVRLPGDVTSNAPTRASNGAVWRPSVVEEDTLDLEATGTRTRTGRVATIAIGGLMAVALVLAGSVRVALWRRRSRP